MRLKSTRQALGQLARLLPAEREASPIDTVLDTAIITPRASWDPAATTRLDAVARRLTGAVPNRADTA